MANLLLFCRLANARSARPRRFRLFNAHVDVCLDENDVQSRFRFGRDPINYLAYLLSDNLARNTAFLYALPSPWALTIRPKIPRRISGNFHRQASGTVFFQCGRR